MKIQKATAIPFLLKTMEAERQCIEMNAFVEKLFREMREAGVFSSMVKGQGIAQCYVRPLWRNTGDVDLFLDETNYEKAKKMLCSIASWREGEGIYSKHLGMEIDGWMVELHGTLRAGLTKRMDGMLDGLQEELFRTRQFRIWKNGAEDICLPLADYDVIFVFTHILQHFYKGGIGLRQICDWARLLWTYRDSIDRQLLEKRLVEGGLMVQWKAFGAYAVEWLGMPAEAMPFYQPSRRYSRKAQRIHRFVMKVGNMGQNRDMSYYDKYPFLIRKSISFFRRLGDALHHMLIFPVDSLRILPFMLLGGFRSAWEEGN